MRIPVSRGAESHAAAVGAAPPCATNPALYQHELLESPPIQSKVTQARWAEYRDVLDEARAACAGCPLFVDCLYRAVAQVDVSGYVGCTTTRERRKIRRMLGVSVAVEDLDEATGLRVDGRRLEHETLLATRAAHPDDTFEQLADRLGCSLSTIKRHLRRVREEAESGQPRARPSNTSVPSVDDVLDVFDSVVEDDR